MTSPLCLNAGVCFVGLAYTSNHSQERPASPDNYMSVETKRLSRGINNSPKLAYRLLACPATMMKSLLYSVVVFTVLGSSNAFAILADEEPHAVPDASSTLLLLGLAMVCLVALQRFMRPARA